MLQRLQVIARDLQRYTERSAFPEMGVREAEDGTGKDHLIRLTKMRDELLEIAAINMEDVGRLQEEDYEPDPEDLLRLATLLPIMVEYDEYVQAKRRQQRSYALHRPVKNEDGTPLEHFPGDEGCPICAVETATDGNPVVDLNCIGRDPDIKHLYHRACIDQWLHQKLVCPLCKAGVYDDAVAVVRYAHPSQVPRLPHIPRNILCAAVMSIIINGLIRLQPGEDHDPRIAQHVLIVNLAVLATLFRP